MPGLFCCRDCGKAENIMVASYFMAGHRTSSWMGRGRGERKMEKGLELHLPFQELTKRFQDLPPYFPHSQLHTPPTHPHTQGPISKRTTVFQ